MQMCLTSGMLDPLGFIRVTIEADDYCIGMIKPHDSMRFLQGIPFPIMLSDLRREALGFAGRPCIFLPRARRAIAGFR